MKTGTPGSFAKRALAYIGFVSLGWAPAVIIEEVGGYSEDPYSALCAVCIACGVAPLLVLLLATSANTQIAQLMSVPLGIVTIPAWVIGMLIGWAIYTLVGIIYTENVRS